MFPDELKLDQTRSVITQSRARCGSFGHCYIWRLRSKAAAFSIQRHDRSVAVAATGGGRSANTSTGTQTVYCRIIQIRSAFIQSTYTYTKYLGTVIVQSCKFKCSLDNANGLFRSTNALFSKLGRLASEDVFLLYIW